MPTKDLALTIRQRLRARGDVVLVLVEPDPYLAYLLRLSIPQAVVVEAPEADRLERLLSLGGIAVVEAASEKAHSIVAAGHKVIGLADPATAPVRTDQFLSVLLRPYLPAEVSQAVRHAAGVRRAHSKADTYDRTRFWLGLLGLIALGFGAIQHSSDFTSHIRIGILSATFVYAAVRLSTRASSHPLSAIDVMSAAALMAVTGGPLSSQIPYGILIALSIGLLYGPRVGGLAGSAIVAASAPMVVSQMLRHLALPEQVGTWLAIFPLAGIAGGLASRTRILGREEGDRLLAQTNEVLSSLHRIAREMPGAFDVGSVCQAALDEIKEVIHPRSAAVLAGEMGTLRTLASFGLLDPPRVVVRARGCALGDAVEMGMRRVQRSGIDPDTAAALGDVDCWLAAPLRHRDAVVGLLLISCEDHEKHATVDLFARRLADQTAVAIENANLFGRVQQMSADRERVRLAGTLHDGVAQELAHLRLELELMARFGTPDKAKGEAERLADEVRSSLQHIRETISELRNVQVAEGLAGSLRAYANDLRARGFDVAVESATGPQLDPQRSTELFRIAQEAVWSALRHAGARFVRITMDATGGRVYVSVHHDGVQSDETARLRDAALASIRAHAQRLGGDAAVQRAGTGSELYVSCPIEPDVAVA